MEVQDVLRNSVLVFECLALLAGLFYYKKYWESPSKWVLIYLFFVVTVEIMGLKMAHDQWMYNILGLMELLVFSYVFYCSVTEPKSKRIILWACLVSVLYLIIDGLFITKSFLVFLSYAFGFISLGISLICFVFLFEMTKTERVLYQNRVLLFWVVIGLLTFHLCNLPVTVLTNQLLEIGNFENIITIQSVASLVMYTCFIIGFVWSHRKYNI
ncbi:MAG: hypothetical protein P1U56_15645 [Saprospiraceae bacterium]|nr:hypothetical protein [Saprospiraceae bacterium]